MRWTHTQNVIVVRLGILQTLHHERGYSIGPTVPIGIHIPSLTSPRRLGEKMAMA